MTTSKLNFASASIFFLLLIICGSLQAQNQYDQYDDYNTYDDYSNNSNSNSSYNQYDTYDQNSGYNASNSYDTAHPLAGVSSKVVSNMQQLKNTRFMKEYLAMQIEIEETITMVKSNSQLYSPEDISQIKIAYRTTAMEFNRVLSELKKGLLEGKYKAKNSIYTHQNLERKLHLLTQFYATHFKNPIAVIMDAEEEIADVQ